MSAGTCRCQGHGPSVPPRSRPVLLHPGRWRITARASTAGCCRTVETKRRHARIARREAVVVDQVCRWPWRCARAERLDDQLAVGLARAGLRRSTGPLRGDGCGVVRAVASRRGRRRVGGHLRRNGRICRTRARAATAAHGQAGRLQVTAGGLAPDPGGLFDPPQRPAEAPQREDLLSFLCAQDVAHAGQERRVPDRRQRLGPLSEMAGFQPSTNGRIWVSTEAITQPGQVTP